MTDQRSLWKRIAGIPLSSCMLAGWWWIQPGEGWVIGASIFLLMTGTSILVYSLREMYRAPHRRTPSR